MVPSLPSSWLGCMAGVFFLAGITGPDVICLETAKNTPLAIDLDLAGMIVTDLDGDLDSDGDVDVFDFATFQQNYGATSGATPEQGDLDGDGDVDIFDFVMMRDNYGTKWKASFYYCSYAAHGTLHRIDWSGRMEYTPAADWTGTDVIYFGVQALPWNGTRSHRRIEIRVVD